MMNSDAYWALGLLLFATGACLGSFFNVVVGRWPLGISVVSPPSRCPKCGHGIRAYHNIPILGWILLRGKCHDCHNPISAEYPVVEALCALLTSLPVLGWAMGIWDLQLTLQLGLLGAVSVPIILIDLRHFLIPNLIVWPAALFAVILTCIPGALSWQESLFWALGSAGALWLFTIIMSKILGKEAMGLGDVQLMVLLGAVLGLKVLFVLPLAAVLGLLGTLILSALPQGLQPHSEDPEIPAGSIPFGPYLCLAALISLIWGKSMWMAYLNLAGVQ